MKKLFLLFALVLTVSMNAWAADYVAYDYLNDVVCTTDQAYTRIYKEPILEDPSFAIFMFIRDSGNGKKCVTWGGYENQNEDILPKIYIDGQNFAQPGWEMCWLNNNPDNGVDTWWDEKNKSCHVYTKEINGVTWTLRFSDVQRYDSRYYFVKMYFCPSEIEGGSRHTITVKGRLTEYVGENTPSTTNYLDVERDFVFDMPKLITSDPIVVKENANEKALSFYGNLAEGAEKSTYFGLYVNDGTVNGFKPYDQLDGKQELAYATTFSNIKYTIPEEYKDKALRVQMHRDFSGLLGGKVSVCHYYNYHDWLYAEINTVHHEAVEPTCETVGNVEYWEDRTTVKYYSDGACTKELSPAQVFTYAKFKSNPVTAYNGNFTFEDATYGGVQFNWAAETTYNASDTGPRSVEFTVYGKDVANARLKWTKNCNDARYGKFTITVYVNGEQKYSVNQNNGESLGGYFAVPLEGLKSYDVVKFEVNKTELAHWAGTPMIAACLEYTSSTGGHNPEITITADDNWKNKGDDDPELTWKITNGALMEGDELTDIKIWREAGENVGLYPIHVSQEEGANPYYDITFVDGVFRIIDAIHHDVSKPTYGTVGFLQECWEDRTTGKYYSDAACTKELNPAQVLTYAKFISNPVTAYDGIFTFEDATYEDVQFNWAAETTYNMFDKGTRSVEFTVYGTDVANARVKWTKNYNAAGYGSFIITVYVNGTEEYSINQGDNALGGLSAIPLPDLKSGDKVKFEVNKPKEASWWDAYPTITACLEYTSSNGGEGMLITANQDPDHTENYYSTFWSSTDAYQVPEGVTAYTGKVEDSTSEPNTSVLKLTAIEDGIIPASQGVILRLTTEDNSATKQQIALVKTTATGTWSGTNALTGTDEATTLGANQYALSLGQHGVGFYLWEGKEIGANKAYLTLNASGSAKAFIFQFDDDPTGIEEASPISSPEGKDLMYDLNGVRVNDSYKGIVIKNGKKIYQK